MASQRQLDLARYLAEGMDGTEAMLKAGWPESTASWLGPNAVAYLAKGGIVVTVPGKPGKASAPAQPKDAGAEAPTGEAGEAADAGDPPTDTNEPARPVRRRATKGSEA